MIVEADGGPLGVVVAGANIHDTKLLKQTIEAVAMTPQEWQSGDSLIADYARNGEVVYG